VWVLPPSEEPALLKETRHLLILTLSRFEFQAAIPEVIAHFVNFALLTERVLDETLDDWNSEKVVGFCLPVLDFADDFRRLLSFGKVDQRAGWWGRRLLP